MADVFISYARDDRDKVTPIAEALKAEGFSVWMDTEIRSGERFRKVIKREALAAACILVCWSPKASDSEWVEAEAEIGRNADKLAQILVDGPDEFSPPLPFGGRHISDLRRNDTREWQQVQNRVLELVQQTLVEIKSPDDLEAWLQALPKEKKASFSVAIASRIALRVAPLLLEDRKQSLRLVLTSLTATALSSIVAPRRIELSAARAAANATLAVNAANAAARAAAHAAAHAALAAANAAANATLAVTAAHATLAALAAHAADALFSSISDDATKLSRGQTPADLVNLSLWANPPPDSLNPNYLLTYLEQPELPESESGWAFWADWYKRAVNGNPRNWDMETEVLSLVPDYFPDTRKPDLDGYLAATHDIWLEYQPATAKPIVNAWSHGPNGIDANAELPDTPSNPDLDFALEQAKRTLEACLQSIQQLQSNISLSPTLPIVLEGVQDILKHDFEKLPVGALVDEYCALIIERCTDMLPGHLETGLDNMLGRLASVINKIPAAQESLKAANSANLSVEQIDRIIQTISDLFAISEDAPMLTPAAKLAYKGQLKQLEKARSKFEKANTSEAFDALQREAGLAINDRAGALAATTNWSRDYGEDYLSNLANETDETARIKGKNAALFVEVSYDTMKEAAFIPSVKAILPKAETAMRNFRRRAKDMKFIPDRED